MKYDPDKHHRRSIRLKDYDYSQQGVYFVTICAHLRECLFGDVVNGAMVLNDYGRIVEQEWLQTGMTRPYIELDAFVVMPNHFHGIVCITDDSGGGSWRAKPLPRSGANMPNPLPDHCQPLSVHSNPPSANGSTECAIPLARR